MKPIVNIFHNSLFPRCWPQWLVSRNLMWMKNMLNHHSKAQHFAYLNANHFDIVRANTPHLLDEAYGLRYQVYCIEKGFEDPARHPDGRETDIDDDRAVHALLVHRRTGAYAGTARVILPSADEPHRLLPTQRILASEGRTLTARGAMAEISRFLVSKQFRRRGGEELYSDVAGPGEGVAGPSERRMAPYITFGLIRGVLEICAEYRITHLCAVMDPALIRILRRFGLDFEKIGDLVDHRGTLQPCVARLEDLVEHSRANGTPLWQYAEGALQFRDCAGSIAA
jgi:N-acyl amino acid synthase of PEP-CTERM/exosortase system